MIKVIWFEGEHFIQSGERCGEGAGHSIHGRKAFSHIFINEYLLFVFLHDKFALVLRCLLFI